jgi:ribose 1,5-bisphosphokinase
MNVRSGRLIYLIGPSGAGKDTVLRWLARHQPQPAQLRIARRTITRAADDPAETHEAVTPEEFVALLRAGAFALHWEANGLRYAIRREELLPLADGLSVVVNGSRAQLQQTRRLYPDLFAVHLSTPPELLRQRLLARGRETSDMIDTRLTRNAQLSSVDVDAEVLNDDTPERAGLRLLAAFGLQR